MLIQDLSRILSEHPFLLGMEPDQVKFLTGCTANVKFEAGEYLFREGGPASLLHLIRAGEAALQVFSPAGGVKTLSTIGPGEIAGWSWVVAPYVSQFDVIALTTVRTISIDAACLRTKCQTDPAFGYQILARMVKVMEQQLLAARLQLLDLYGTSR